MKELSLLLTIALPTVAFAQKTSIGETDENFSKAPAAAAGAWIYNDLAKGFAEAKAAGKPIMVVYRCIP